MEKDVQNTNAVAHKLKPASTKVINLRREEAKKKQEVVDRQKAKAMIKKQWKDREKNSLSIKDDRYYDSDTYSTDLD